MYSGYSLYVHTCSLPYLKLTGGSTVIPETSATSIQGMYSKAKSAGIRQINITPNLNNQAPYCNIQQVQQVPSNQLQSS